MRTADNDGYIIGEVQKRTERETERASARKRLLQFLGMFLARPSQRTTVACMPGNNGHGTNDRPFDRLVSSHVLCIARCMMALHEAL